MVGLLQLKNVRWDLRGKAEETTHEGREGRDRPGRESQLAPDKGGVRGALDVGKYVGCEILDGADHVVEPHEERAPLLATGRTRELES